MKFKKMTTALCGVVLAAALTACGNNTTPSGKKALVTGRRCASR